MLSVKQTKKPSLLMDGWWHIIYAITLLAIMTRFTHLTNDFAHQIHMLRCHERYIDTYDIMKYANNARQTAISIPMRYLWNWTHWWCDHSQNRIRKKWDEWMNEWTNDIHLHVQQPLFSPKLNIVSKFSSIIECCFCTWCPLAILFAVCIDYYARYQSSNTMESERGRKVETFEGRIASKGKRKRLHRFLNLLGVHLIVDLHLVQIYTDDRTKKTIIYNVESIEHGVRDVFVCYSASFECMLMLLCVCILKYAENFICTFIWLVYFFPRSCYSCAFIFKNVYNMRIQFWSKLNENVPIDALSWTTTLTVWQTVSMKKKTWEPTKQHTKTIMPTTNISG